MLICVNNQYGIDDLFISTKLKKNFQRAERLGFTVNTDSREMAAMISPDGNWLFFSSDAPGGFGGLDIYYSRKLPNGDWSFPFNAGNIINTQYEDNFPYIAPTDLLFTLPLKVIIVLEDTIFLNVNGMNEPCLFQYRKISDSLSIRPKTIKPFPFLNPEDTPI